MKKLMLLLAALVLVLTLSACTDLCIGTECYVEETDDKTDPIDEVDPTDEVDPESPSASLDNVIYYAHLNGHGTETEDSMGFVLFEYEMRDFVKYQVAYLSCTCRNPDINYWNIAYVEINKSTNDISNITFGPVFDVSTGHDYNPATWGDSSPTPGGKYLEDFEDDFFPWLEGKTSADLEGIVVFTNDEYHGLQNTKDIAETDLIDDFAGSSVSTNNLIRIMKSLLEYHENNY